ncbi:hypothetical protein N9O82_01270, partial [Methylophilaceae bacterium]|nr:hypothetical protein [Methylophilaceae bacterium]
MNFIKNKDFLSTILLFLAFLITFVQFIKIGLTGDDPFIYMDAFRKGGIFEASLGQAIGQGRFWLLIAWTTTQLPYIFDNLVLVNLIKIISTFIFFQRLYKLIKDIYGIRFSRSLIFLSLMLLNYGAGDFS